MIEKLNVKIKDKIYTEQELETLEMELLKYYKDEDMDNETLKETLELSEEISREE